MSRYTKITRYLCYLYITVLISSCRRSTPPPIEICIGDGLGGADCISALGEKFYRPPSELMNFWMSPQSDFSKFAQWCYDANQKVVNRRLDDMLIEMRTRP